MVFVVLLTVAGVYCHCLISCDFKNSDIRVFILGFYQFVDEHFKMSGMPSLDFVIKIRKTDVMSMLCTMDGNLL